MKTLKLTRNALSAAVLAAVASQAHAIVDFGDGTALPGTAQSVYSQELSYTGGIPVSGASNEATGQFGVAMQPGDELYVRFDVSNGVLDNGASSLNAANGACGAGSVIGSSSTPSLHDDQFLIFSISPDGSNIIQSNDIFCLETSLNLSSAGTASLTYAVYDSLSGANRKEVNNIVVNERTASWVSFEDSLSVTSTSTDAGVKKINVSEASAKFDDTSNDVLSSLGKISLDINDNVTNDGSTPLATNVAGTLDVVVNGDFSAAAASGVTLNEAANCAGTAIGSPATVDTANNTATFTAFTANDSANNEFYVCMQVNGTTELSTDKYTADVTYKYAAYGLPDDATTVDLATFEKNGSTAELMAVQKGGQRPAYVRVNNVSTQTGNVFVTMYNEAGESVTFDLGDVDGASTEMAGNSGSGSIAFSKYVQAAAAADSTWVASGKTRIVFNGEIPEGKLKAQTFVFDKDGQGFDSMTQD